MGKNILIYSDGTGQAGGLTPDERRSNVYKLFRATRCGSDTNIDPAKQITFYDPGLGSQGELHGPKIGWMRWVYNLLSQMTGLGITHNIIDCYAAIIQMWQPGDRIYLFGFSRGAYTVRCVGGVLANCGVPVTKDGAPIKLDTGSVTAIAKEAVKKVYQHGASKSSERFRRQRAALALQFRKKYGSDANGQSNAVPYFIGVWDTVAALGASWIRLFLAAVGLLLFVAGLSLLLSYSFGSWLPLLGLAFWPSLGTFKFWFETITGISASIFGVGYLATHVKYAFGTGDPFYKTIHMVGWRLKFYDKNLNDRVEYARHALSIDENRKDFPRVEWTNAESIHPEQNAGINWFEQIWFAGNHSDVGGSYPENESRLSDISLKWMSNEAQRFPYPIYVDKKYLILFPSSAGMQHDEVRSGIGGIRFLHWFEKHRKVPPGAFLHPTVFERLKLDEVQIYDTRKKYAPEPLNHEGPFNAYDVIPPP